MVVFDKLRKCGNLQPSLQSCQNSPYRGDNDGIQGPLIAVGFLKGAAAGAALAAQAPWWHNKYASCSGGGPSLHRRPPTAPSG